MEKAYERACRAIILEEFYKMGFRGNMMNFLREFLNDRYIKVKIGNYISKAFKQEEGVPQGSVLSVTCFSVAINKIVQKVSSPVKCSLFVDDFLMYVSSYDAATACNYLQKSINEVTKWAEENGFRFSSSKTVAVRFTRMRRIEAVPNLMLNDCIIPYEEQVRFLGIIFDRKLTWGPHIDNLKIKVKKSLNILKVVSHFEWGADRKSLLKIYNSLCRSKLDYACEVYSSACKTRLKELDVIHNLGLRICTGAYKTSPIESIYIDSGELPLQLRREELGLLYMQRLKSSVDNPASECLKEKNPYNFNKPRATKPFQIRFLRELEDKTIESQEICEFKYLNVPPWLVPDIKLCKKTIVKKEMSSQEMYSKFIEHNSIHRDQEKIFTDGSKSRDGVGCAVLYQKDSYQAWLSKKASVFTAEMTAIIESLKMINQGKKKDFVIYSDSYSAVLALSQYNSFHPLVQKAQEWLFRLHIKFKNINFCWVPSHVGIHQNEIVDKEAKEAAKLPSVNIKSIPSIDMKGPIKQYILCK